MTTTFSGKAALVIEDVIAFRRELHMYPELSGEEVETSQKIQSMLEKYGIPYQTGYAKTGVLGIIKGGKPGKTIALRADIDALPITENIDCDFKSKVDGKMHACGHDAHTAMLLGAGKLLFDHKEEIDGTVLLVFQPAEEDAPYGGAKQMMEDGVFNTYQPDVIIAQHVWPDLPVGTFGLLPGPMMGNSDRFKIVVKGSGGHASMPQHTTDAIIVANQIITMLQTIVSRNVNPVDSAVITVGKIEGGYRYNVVADIVTLEGTVRSFSNETKEKVKSRFHEVVHGVAKSMGATTEIEYLDGYPATVNTPKWVERIKQSAINLYGEQSVPKVIPSLGGEDFSRFLLKYPGAYFWLGSSIGDNQKPLHDPYFILNEDALPYGVELFAQATMDILNQLNKEAEVEVV